MRVLFLICELLIYRVICDNRNLPAGCVVAEGDCPNPNVTFWLYTMETQNNPYELNVAYPESIEKSEFVSDAPVVILIHGYTGYRDYSPNAELRPAYFERGPINIISVDYMELAKDPCYITAVMNVPVIGKCCAQLIEVLVTKRGIPLENFHVLGFSLGAQVAGAIGNFMEIGQLERITGLDPAMPLFTDPDNNRKVDSSDAKFVQIIHTDSLQKGKFEATGHADFYVNGGMEQKGCPRDNMTKSGCSHWRAVAYYAESINSKLGFYGMKCSSWFSYMLGWCRWTKDSEESIMGEYTSNTVRGLHFVETNSEPPFARGHVNEQNETPQGRSGTGDEYFNDFQ